MTLSCIHAVKRHDDDHNVRPTPGPIYIDSSYVGDRSGSMATTRGGSQEGAVAYMQLQQASAEKLKPSAGEHLEFVSFDNKSIILYSNKATELTDKDLTNISEGMEPRSMTKLYDTIIETLTRQMERIDNKKLSLSKSVQETIKDYPWMIGTSCAITTDGIDNMSKNTISDCRNIIKKYKTEYGGSVMFIGANINAEHTASRMGIGKEFALQMGSDKNSSINAAKAVSFAQTRSISQGPQNVGGSLAGLRGFSQHERAISCCQNANVVPAPVSIGGPCNTSGSLCGDNRS